MNSEHGIPEQGVDLVVIGGGFHGAMAAWEASRRGLKVVLLERGRLAGGTTANSLRIVHGGLRYLQRLDWRRMQESAREQRFLLEQFPEWITPLRCVVPAGGPENRGATAYRMGFAAANAILRNSAHPSLPEARIVSRAAFAAAAPWHASRQYSAGAEWHDARIANPEGLVRELIARVVSGGGFVLEHTLVTEVIVRNGKVRGVRAVDQLTRQYQEISCGAVINAAGPWIKGLAPSSASVPTRWARAINLVLSLPPRDCAVGVPSMAVDPVLGKRMMFLVPCGDQTLLGTSYRLETDDTPHSIERHAEEFRTEWNCANPGLQVRPQDIVAIHSGRLPLRDGFQRGNPETLASRGAVIDHTGEGIAGLVSIAGVKLTTARLMAERAVNAAERHAGDARLKILVLAPHPFFQARGTPIAVRSVVEFLTQAGHHVDLLAYHEGNDVQIPGCRLLRIPRIPGVHNVRPGFSLKKIFCDAVMLVSCLRLARRNRYDLVHAVEESVFMAAAIRRMSGVPFVYDMDSALVEQMVEKHPGFKSVSSWLDRWVGAAVRRSEGIVAVCPALVDVARRYAPSQLIALVEDTTLLNGSNAAVEPLRRDGGGETLFLYVGNLERYQGIDLMLDAFAIAAQRISASLVLIGGTPEDVAHYRDKARNLGISEQVRFLGPRPLVDLRGYLEQADVLVSPRLTGNNTPMKIYSYLDAGVPVLATRLPTHTQVLHEGIAALAEPSPEAMAAEMIRLALDPARRTALATQGRELAQREFTSEAAQRKLATFYHAIEQRLARAVC